MDEAQYWRDQAAHWLSIARSSSDCSIAEILRVLAAEAQDLAVSLEANRLDGPLQSLAA